MPLRMTKAWQPLNDATAGVLPAHLGVYQLGDADGAVVFIGCADARTRFGLRECVLGAAASPPAGAVSFRIESTMTYRTRYLELLQVHVHDHGAPPPGNVDVDVTRLGILRPGG